MATTESGNSGGMGSVLRDMRMALGDLFAGGRIEPRDAVMVQVLFGLLGHLARADGIVTSHEAEFVNALMDELALPLKARGEAMASFERGHRRQVELATELQRFVEAHPRGTEQASKLYDALLRLAVADGRVRPREREILQEVTIRLGFDPAVLEDRLKRLGAMT